MTKASEKRVSCRLWTLFNACHAIIMDMTTVFPDQVAIFNARRMSFGLLASFASRISASIQWSQALFARSITYMSVSNASIWQKNRRFVLAESVQCSSKSLVTLVTPGHPWFLHSETRCLTRFMNSFSWRVSEVHSESSWVCAGSFLLTFGFATGMKKALDLLPSTISWDIPRSSKRKCFFGSSYGELIIGFIKGIYRSKCQGEFSEFFLFRTKVPRYCLGRKQSKRAVETLSETICQDSSILLHSKPIKPRKSGERYSTALSGN